MVHDDGSFNRLKQPIKTIPSVDADGYRSADVPQTGNRILIKINDV